MNQPAQDPPRGDAGHDDGSTEQFPRVVDRIALRTLYEEPLGIVRRKQLRHLDIHCRRFIQLSPLVCVATSGSDGSCDVSPRGDAPGFVAVLNDHFVAIPDRKGNNRVDGMQNLLENPHIGLLFIVPGIDDTLRVNGRASIGVDDDLLTWMAVDGKRPKAAILVEVDEAFLHCGRAFKRGRVWDPLRFLPRGEMPTMGEMLKDQTSPDRAEREILADSEDADLY